MNSAHKSLRSEHLPVPAGTPQAQWKAGLHLHRKQPPCTVARPVTSRTEKPKQHHWDRNPGFLAVWD